MPPVKRVSFLLAPLRGEQGATGLFGPDDGPMIRPAASRLTEAGSGSAIGDGVAVQRMFGGGRRQLVRSMMAAGVGVASALKVGDRTLEHYANEGRKQGPLRNSERNNIDHAAGNAIQEGAAWRYPWVLRGVNRELDNQDVDLPHELRDAVNENLANPRQGDQAAHLNEARALARAAWNPNARMVQRGIASAGAVGNVVAAGVAGLRRHYFDL